MARDAQSTPSVVRYRTIVADPPWPYPQPFSRNKGGRYGDGTNDAESAPLPYASMTLAEIKALPVGDFADKDAWLWLWTTNFHLPVSFAVAEAWGFAYAQTMVWNKTDGHPRFPSVAAVNRSEFLLVARKGKPSRLSPWPSNVVDVPFNPARLKHSQKPEKFLDLIEQVCPGPYLELFARRNRLGWDTWGNEALNHIEVGA